ncbi:DUF3298 domain-containing protein [Helicobacter sp. MIT 11-5569]|uniref:RsiV family protein n=1 Tax=Helicobacter sp. MIT 11-5569 TaxID=1548151 RepID=UPI00068EC019|nr:RsiV family protein [Helicobacter sp. MIT 11-5569]TLD82687.1 DUF3298 domain-containing protein [Helicobacter sp. MIT 11-5569]
MKRQSLKLSAFFGAFILYFSAPSVLLGSTMDFSYQTFVLPQTFLQSKLFVPIKKVSKQQYSLLFVADSKEGILYAGNQALGRCVPLIDEKSQFRESNAVKNGTLQCKNLSFKVENGVITEAFNAKSSEKLNLEITDSFVLKSQEASYEYPKKSKRNPATSAKVSTQFYCSDDLKIQESLEVLYGVKFDCKNAQKVFLEIAQDSMWSFLEDFQEETEIKNEEKAMEEFLKFSSLEQLDGDSLYYFDENLRVFLHDNYLYTGGAHGMKSQWGVILSKTNHEILDLTSLIDFQNPKLKNLLWQEYQNYLKKLGDTGEPYTDLESFYTSKAVLIDYDSFVFIYQPYEIMPYAYGIIKLKIPLEQMAQFVQATKTPLESLFVK